MSPFEGYILIQQGSEPRLDSALKSLCLNPNSRFKKETLLSTAIKKTAPNLLRLLLHHGADPNLVSYENGRYEPAIITAVRYKSLTCVQILLAYGAQPDKRNFYGTDAIFQAVHENTYDILDFLLVERTHCHHPHRQQNVQPIPLSSRNPFGIQRANKTTTGETEEGALKLKISEQSFHNKSHEDDDHVLCPFYYALNHAISYPCKRKSLVRLLQSYYKCKCLEEIASCSNSSKPNTAGTPPSATFPFHHDHDAQNQGNQVQMGGREHEKAEEIRKCLMLVSTLATHEKSVVLLEEKHNNRKTSPPGDHDAVNSDNNGEDIKLRVQKELSYYPYKIFKIQGKCHTIKENESSAAPSSSYVVLTGPLKLSCITREVIRDQIMLCASYASSRSFGTDEGSSRKVLAARSFRKSLDSLTIPLSLKDFIMYKNINELGQSGIHLMKKDLQLSLNYFGIYIF